MGLISGLLLFPITGPVYGLQFILDQIRNEAEAELLDEGRIRAELLNLSQLRDIGEISAEEHAAMEDALIEHLNMIRAYKEGLLDLVEVDQATIDDSDASGVER